MTPGDPAGQAARACGRDLGKAVPMSVRKGFEAVKSVTVAQALKLLYEGRRAFVWIHPCETGRLPWLVELDRYSIVGTLKVRADHEALTQFVLQEDGNLILQS